MGIYEQRQLWWVLWITTGIWAIFLRVKPDIRCDSKVPWFDTCGLRVPAQQIKSVIQI